MKAAGWLIATGVIIVLVVAWRRRKRRKAPAAVLPRPSIPSGHPDLKVKLRPHEKVALDGIEAVSTYGVGLAIFDSTEEET